MSREPTFADLQEQAERVRALGARSDRSFRRLMDGLIGPDYPRRLAAQMEEEQGDLDRIEYALGLDYPEVFVEMQERYR